jgi:hypothetical protein
LLVFAVSLILCTGKWIKHFTETVLAFNHPFSADMTQLTGKESGPFERAVNPGLETTLRFYIYNMYIAYPMQLDLVFERVPRGV